MKNALILCTVLLLTPAVDTGVYGQQDRIPVFHTDVSVVNIFCTVQKKKEYLTNLTRNDFRIYEDGVPQEITYFSLERGADAQPLNIVLLIDTSGSVKDKLFFEQEAAAVSYTHLTLPTN